MDRTETHSDISAGTHMPEVKPVAARRARVATTIPAIISPADPLEQTLAAACETICDVFVAQADDVEAWLNGACKLVLRLIQETSNSKGVRGVWVSLLDGLDPRAEGSPFAGAAGFVDDIEREEIRTRTRELVREAAERDWAPRRVSDRAVPETPDWARAISTMSAAVADGQGSEAVLFLGVVGGQDAGITGLGPALRTVWDGIVRASGERIIRPRAARRRLVRGLSGAQRQVLELLIEGITEHEIACRLGRSRHTVHDHVRTIYKTLGLSSKAELITAWNDAGRR